MFSATVSSTIASTFDSQSSIEFALKEGSLFFF